MSLCIKNARIGSSRMSAGGSLAIRSLFLRNLSRRKISGPHAIRRDCSLEQTRIKHLVEIFKYGKKEQLVAALVETGARNDYRTTNSGPWVVVLILWFL